MKYILYAASAFCVMSMYSCREKPASRPAVLNRQLTLPTGNPGAGPANPVLPGTGAMATHTTTTKINPAHGQPGHRCDIAVGSPIPASTNTNANAALPATPKPAIQPASLPITNDAAPAPTASGLNPAHGQPGHRCDIAVGAPLSSKPAGKAEPIAVTPAASKPIPLAPDNLLSKGLNPAHGQPGHRCDVAVGKPLNEPKKTDAPPSTVVPLQAAGN